MLHVRLLVPTELFAQVVALIVHLRGDTPTNLDGTSCKRRWVSEIVHVTPGEAEKGYALTHVFAAALSGVDADPASWQAAPEVLPPPATP